MHQMNVEYRSVKLQCSSVEFLLVSIRCINVCYLSNVRTKLLGPSFFFPIFWPRPLAQSSWPNNNTGSVGKEKTPKFWGLFFGTKLFTVSSLLTLVASLKRCLSMLNVSSLLYKLSNETAWWHAWTITRKKGVVKISLKCEFLEW